jgi:dynactin complex subunit
LRTLTDFLVKHAFYSFSWPAYLSELKPDNLNGNLEQNIRDLNNVVKKVEQEVLHTPFLTVQEFQDRFLAAEHSLKELQIKIRTQRLAEKFLKSQSAKGNFYFNESMEKKVVITELSWLANVIQMLSVGNTKSNDVDYLSKTLGQDVPVWTLGEFTEELEKLVSKEKVFKMIKQL